MSGTEPAQDQQAVTLTDIGKEYRMKDSSVLALERVDLSVARQEFVCIVGPSGCGKSTLLKIVAGLTSVTRGEVRVFGEQVLGPHRDVGMVFQAPVLLKWRNILNNVLFPVDILKESRKEHVARARELLRLVGLEGFEGRRPSELSGGMQQRAAIARALIHDPRLLLMDEPFGALDQITREQMNMELTRIWAEARKTTILITHSIEEAVFLADRVLVMTARPARVAGIVDVNLPRPRHRDVRLTPEFNEIEGEVERLLGGYDEEHAQRPYPAVEG